MPWLAPNRAWLDRDHDVQPLAAGRFYEAFQPDVIETGADIARGVDHRAPQHILSGIEIEDQPIGPLELRRR